MATRSKDPWAKKSAKGMKTLTSILKTGEKVVKAATSTPKTKKTTNRTYSKTTTVSSYSSYNSLYSNSTSTKQYHPTSNIIIGIAMVVASLVLMYFIISYFKGIDWPLVGFLISMPVVGILGGFGIAIAMETKAVEDNDNSTSTVVNATDKYTRSINIPSSSSSFDYIYWTKSYNIVNELWSFTDKLNLDWGFHKSTGELKGVNINLTNKTGFEDTFVGKVRFLVMMDIAENITRGGGKRYLAQDEGLILILYCTKLLGNDSIFNYNPQSVYSNFSANYPSLAKSCVDFVNQAMSSKPSVDQTFLLSYALHDYSESLQKEYISYMLQTAELFSSADNYVDEIEKNWINTIKDLKIGK